MPSLWEKINQKLHHIVDRALDARSLFLYDQYLRDVNAYQQQITESAARMYAGIQSNKRHLERYQEELVALSNRVSQLEKSDDEQAARVARADLDAKQQLIDTTRAQIARQDMDYRRLLAGRVEAAERLKLLQAERPAVESLLAVIRAGELIESIEITLGSIASLGSESVAGGIAQGILQRFDEAEERWQQVAAQIGVDGVSIEMEKTKIEDQLAERMRRLGLDEEE